MGVTKGEGCATGVDRLTTGTDVCRFKGEDCETVVDNWSPTRMDMVLRLKPA